MGIVHEEPICRRYFAGAASLAGLFFYFGVVVTIVVPWLIGYFTGGFYIKEASYVSQPRAVYTQKAILSLTTSDGKEYMWVSNKAANELIDPARLLFPLVTVRVEDVDDDLHAEFFNFKISVPTERKTYAQDPFTHTPVVFSTETLQFTAVQILMFFDYRFESGLRVEGIAHIEHNSATPATSLHINGDLLLKQRSPVTPWTDFESVYNASITDLAAAKSLQQLDISDIVRTRFKQTVSTQFIKHSAVFKSAAQNTFDIHATIGIPLQKITYQPNVFEVLKYAWIQYLSIAVVVGYLCNRITRFLVIRGILPTRLVALEPPKRL